jgi:TonB family protein
MLRLLRNVLLCVATASTVAACDKTDRVISVGLFGQRPAVPDEMPALVSTQLPFHYPPLLYARRIQGNVTLKLFLDADGRVVVDSTRVVEPSGDASLDSAAIAGAGDLRFTPAKLHGAPMATSILFPVYFRHPEARPLPGDTILTATKKA